MYIKELDREITGRALEIWEGRSGLPAWKEQFYRDRWLMQKGKPRGESSPPPPAPCAHIGAAIRGADAPDTQRDWHRCDHPRMVELGIAAVVCSCRGCSAKCKGYEA